MFWLKGMSALVAALVALPSPPPYLSRSDASSTAKKRCTWNLQTGQRCGAGRDRAGGCGRWADQCMHPCANWLAGWQISCLPHVTAKHSVLHGMGALAITSTHARHAARRGKVPQATRCAAAYHRFRDIKKSSALSKVVAATAGQVKQAPLHGYTEWRRTAGGAAVQAAVVLRLPTCVWIEFAPIPLRPGLLRAPRTREERQQSQPQHQHPACSHAVRRCAYRWPGCEWRALRAVGTPSQHHILRPEAWSSSRRGKHRGWLQV